MGADRSLAELTEHDLFSRPDDDEPGRKHLRLVEAIEEVHAAGKALGIDVNQIGELYSPLSVRADAWLHRTDQLLADRSWDRIEVALRRPVVRPRRA